MGNRKTSRPSFIRTIGARFSLLTIAIASLPLSSLAQHKNWVSQYKTIQKNTWSSDFEIVNLTMDKQPIALFKTTLNYLDRYTEADFGAALNQNALFKLPENLDIKGFEVIQNNINNESCSAEKNRLALSHVFLDFKESSDFDLFINQPELMYRGLSFETPDIESFKSVHSTLNVVMSYYSKITLPPQKSKTTVLDQEARFQNVLRKINLKKLLSLADRALSSRKKILALVEANCLQIADVESAKLNTISVEKDLISLKEMTHEVRQTSLQNPQLPLPELNSSDRRILSLYLGSFLWRFRGAGGYADIPTQTRRNLFVENGFAQIGYLNGAGEAGVNAAWWLRWGVQFTSWGKYFDMGRNPGGTKYEDFQEMSKLGPGITKRAKASLSSAGYQSIALTYAGSMLGSCYYYAWEKMPPLYMIAGDVKSPMAGLSGIPTGIGELCFGANLGLALSTAYQNPK